MTKGTCQSNNLIYCIEYNWCHIKYVGQTKNRIIDRFKGHLFDIKNNLNTTVARHFGSHSDILDPNMTIHILEYIRLPKDLPRSSSLRDNRELVWIHRLNTLIPNGLNILDWVVYSGGSKEYKQKAACITQQYYPCLWGVIPWMYTPSTPIFEVIHPPCIAIFVS